MGKQGNTIAIETNSRGIATEQDASVRGLIFDILSFAVHDGPGSRTLVFLKGCPLKCNWCSNPEGIEPYQEVMYSPMRCQHCHDCIQACPFTAISVNQDQSISIDRQLCRNEVCSKNAERACVQACHNEGLSVVASYISIDELMKRMERERRFWGPDGGVTLSGGEPMYQPEFAIAFLERCQKEYIHTAIETCGHVAWKYYERALCHLDWLFYDIKCMDTARHKDAVGVSNKLILENIEKISIQFRHNGQPRVIIRVPIIPGFNDSEQNIRATAEFMDKINLSEVNILPFHRLGASKYERLGLAYKCRDLLPPTPESLMEVQGIFESYGLRAYIGSSTPF